MPQKPFADALNEQIANEFAAHQQYIGAAVYYESETLPRLAAFFYRQAVEERNHAMMMVQYLLDANQEVRIPDIEAKLTRFDDVVAPVRMALDQEQRVTEEINALFKLARDNGDYQAEQFMQWFVKEQVEEVSIMTDLLTVVERSADNALLVEEYLRAGEARRGAGRPDRPAGGRRRARNERVRVESTRIDRHRTPHQVADLLAWVIVFAALMPLGSKLSDETMDDTASYLPQSAESTEVVHILDREFSAGETTVGLIVYQREGGLTAADKRMIAADATEIQAPARRCR